MPVHFNLITAQDSTDLFVALTKDELQAVDEATASPDRKFALLTKYFPDVESGYESVRCVYTLRCTENNFELLDLDLVIPSEEKPVSLKFLELLPDSSDADEYYSVKLSDSDIELEIETVNRHLIEGDLIDRECKVHLSAFPISLRVYDDVETMNRDNGWDTELEVGDKVIHIDGIAGDFMAPGSASAPSKVRGEDDYHTIIVGEVAEYEKTTIEIGEYEISFGIAQVKSAAGIIPTIINLSHKQSELIEPGKIVMMQAIVKANFAED